MRIPRSFRPSREAAILGQTADAAGQEFAGRVRQADAASGAARAIAGGAANIALSERRRLRLEAEEQQRQQNEINERDAGLNVLTVEQESTRALAQAAADNYGIVPDEALEAYETAVLDSIEAQGKVLPEWKAAARARAQAGFQTMRTSVFERNLAQSKVNYRQDVDDNFQAAADAGDYAAMGTTLAIIQDSDDFTGEEKRKYAGAYGVATRMGKVNEALAAAETDDDIRGVVKMIENFRTDPTINEDVREDLIDAANAEVRQRRGELAILEQRDAKAEKAANDRLRAERILAHAEVMELANAGLIDEEGLQSTMDMDEVTSVPEQANRYVQALTVIRAAENRERFRASIYDGPQENLTFDPHSSGAKRAAESQYVDLLQAGLEADEALLSMLERSPVVPQSMIRSMAAAAEGAAEDPASAREMFELYRTIDAEHKNAQLNLDPRAKLFYETALNSRAGVNDSAAFQLAYRTAYETDQRTRESREEVLRQLPARSFEEPAFAEAAIDALTEAGIGSQFLWMTSALELETAEQATMPPSETTLDDRIMNFFGVGTAPDVYSLELQQSMEARVEDYLLLGSDMPTALSLAAKDMASTWAVSGINDGVEGAGGHDYGTQLLYEPMPASLAKHAREVELPKVLEGREFYVTDPDDPTNLVARTLDPSEVAIVRQPYAQDQRADGALLYELHYKGSPIRNLDQGRVLFTALPETAGDLEAMTAEEIKTYEREGFDLYNVMKKFGVN